MSKKTYNFDFDTVIKELGQFGRYQLFNYILICIPIAFSASYTLSYVFTAGDLNYRCEINECDHNNLTETTINTYNPEWLKNAVPFIDDNLPSQCLQYEFNHTTTIENNTCSINNFNRTIIKKCDKFIFEDINRKTIANEWNLTCIENKWKLALVGTINNIGQFTCLPFTGLVSDKFGRRFVFVMSILICGVFGLMRSFSTSYLMFILFEFLDPALGSGIYSAGFILGMELVGPKRRILGGAMISCFYAIGEAVLGLIAMNVNNWRVLLRITYIPAFLCISYFWLIPESVRWLVMKGKREEAAKIILRAAKINKITFSDSDLLKLQGDTPQLPTGNYQEKKIVKYECVSVFRSPALLLRVANCSFCWLTNTLIYYGLSLNSVSIAGNAYINFILICLIEIPGYLITYLLVDRIGRRKSLCGALLISGTACMTSAFITKSIVWLPLLCFLIGKCAITVSFTVLYVYTAELFPTNLRHSLLGTCSMFGRIGSMIAPQSPLLITILPQLPSLLFGGCAILSGLMILQFPETLNTSLPDTIEDALNIGKKKVEVDIET